jgi:anti-sigma factor RsiW
LGKLDCKDILRTMSDYISGELGESICEDIEAHLTTCKKCRFHVDAVRYTINLFDEWRADDMPRDTELRLRVKLKEETGCFNGGPDGDGGRKRTRKKSRKREK